MIQCITKLNNNRRKTNLTNLTIKYSNICNNDKPKHEDYAVELLGNTIRYEDIFIQTVRPRQV